MTQATDICALNKAGRGAQLSLFTVGNDL